MEEMPTWASTLGDHRYDDRWPELTLKAQGRRETFDRRMLEKLEDLDPLELDPTDQLNLELFVRKLEDDVAEKLATALDEFAKRFVPSTGSPAVGGEEAA